MFFSLLPPYPPPPSSLDVYSVFAAPQFFQARFTIGTDRAHPLLYYYISSTRAVYFTFFLINACLITRYPRAHRAPQLGRQWSRPSDIFARIYMREYTRGGRLEIPLNHRFAFCVLLIYLFSHFFWL